MIPFFKFVLGPIPPWRHFIYRQGGEHWCPRRLAWTMDFTPPKLESYPAIWARRARRWFQGKRDYQKP